MSGAGLVFGRPASTSTALIFGDPVWAPDAAPGVVPGDEIAAGVRLGIAAQGATASAAARVDWSPGAAVSASRKAALAPLSGVASRAQSLVAGDAPAAGAVRRITLPGTDIIGTAVDLDLPAQAAPIALPLDTHIRDAAVASGALQAMTPPAVSMSRMLFSAIARAAVVARTALGLTPAPAPCGRVLVIALSRAGLPAVGYWQPSRPVDPPIDPELHQHRLLFWRPATDSLALIFGLAPTGRAIVPALEVYIVINDFALVRVSDSAPIHADNFRAQIGVDDWCWRWSADVPISALALVRPVAAGDAVELLANINGHPLRLLVNDISRSRRWLSDGLAISGLGRAGWLAAPYAPMIYRSNTSLMTAQQLLDDALTESGVPIGWSVDWQIDDWPVPAGAWSYDGEYKGAANRIAEAGGGYVQGHDTEQTLLVLPRYPVAPWALAGATPDIELPENVCELESLTLVERPVYNAVYVIGGSVGGRRDRIIRTGSGASPTAPSISDPLATDPIMTRQRGLAALADSGRQTHISLRLPVLPETGLIKPGQIVRYTESGTVRTGISRDLSIEVGEIDTWQTVRIETHEPI